MKLVSFAILLLLLGGCSGDGTVVCNDGNCEATDSGSADGSNGTADSGSDAGNTDGSSDSGSDSGNSDGGGTDGDADGGSDGGGNDGDADAGSDGSADSGNTDGQSDSGSDGGSDGGSGGGQNNTLASGLTTRHRNGQTFLVWDEPNGSAGYHVYRASQPITTANLENATRLTERWGPLDQDSSINRHGDGNVPAQFVIDDLGQPLDSDQGLFVHTIQSGRTGNAYYAITTVDNGTENRTIVAGSNATRTPTAEFVNTPRPVLTVSVNDGKGRIYTQYMDYASWNPTLNGYAFNYAVALPFNYNPAQSYPLQLQLHAFGTQATFVSQSEFDWQVIQLFPTDPGSAQNTIHTWWYGHAADHDYQRNGSIPFSGNVENFTEQRLLLAINEVIANPDFNVNTDLIHAYGNSMGASGVLSLGLRYPSVFAGIYASQPMTNYASSPIFQENLVQLWGEQSTNLGIVNAGPSAQDISDYDATGSQPTGVWDWMNHHQQLRRRSADDHAFLIMDFGKADGTIDWATQGAPMFQALTDGKAAFAATAYGGVGHSWQGFRAVDHNLFGFGNDALAAWRYPNTLSYPSIQNASGSGQLSPAVSGNDEYNINIDWATPQNAFGPGIVDTTRQWEITLRSLASNQTADITPRKTRFFRPAAGQLCGWSASRANDNTQIASGLLTIDSNALATAPAVPVNSGAGTRLVIDCP